MTMKCLKCGRDHNGLTGGDHATIWSYTPKYGFEASGHIVGECQRELAAFLKGMQPITWEPPRPLAGVLVEIREATFTAMANKSLYDSYNSLLKIRALCDAPIVVEAPKPILDRLANIARLADDIRRHAHIQGGVRFDQIMDAVHEIERVCKTPLAESGELPELKREEIRDLRRQLDGEVDHVAIERPAPTCDRLIQGTQTDTFGPLRCGKPAVCTEDGNPRCADCRVKVEEIT